MDNRFGPIGDSQFWKDVGERIASPYRSLQDFGKIPERADNIAQEMFPSSPRDFGTQNSFRHALGTGMMTQALGGGPVAGTMAKGAGYIWEGLGIKDLINKPAHREDTLHDLNANALGASVAQRTMNQQDLVQALKQMALQSVPVKPPNIFSSSPGYMTRTAQ